MRNDSTLPSCLYLQQQDSGFSQSSSFDQIISPEICTNMNDDFGSQFPFQSEGFQRNQALLNYSGSALSSEFSYFTPADTIDAAIYQIPSRKADKETDFGQPIQSENSRVLRKRPLDEDLVLRGGFSGLISNSVVPDEVKRLKSKATEPTMDAESVKAPARRSQKLSDKITSLQKVVSPYGKTDTASVLQEACMYIKIAHQEVRRLAVSYFGSRPFLHPQRNGFRIYEAEGYAWFHCLSQTNFRLTTWLKVVQSIKVYRQSWIHGDFRDPYLERFM